MSSAMVTYDWRQLSESARQERDPKKFAILLKQLYDAMNEGEKEHGVSRKAKRRLAKAAGSFPEISCALCSKPLDLQTDLCADEKGKAAHEDCYVSRLISSQTNQKAS
jgi:hypothetical protein